MKETLAFSSKEEPRPLQTEFSHLAYFPEYSILSAPSVRGGFFRMRCAVKIRHAHPSGHKSYAHRHFCRQDA